MPIKALTASTDQSLLRFIEPLWVGAPAARRGRYRAQHTCVRARGPRRVAVGMVPIRQRFTVGQARTGRFAALSPTSESVKTRLSPSRTGTWLGTQSTVQPAVSADRAPVLESSIARQSAASTPRSRAALR